MRKKKKCLDYMLKFYDFQSNALSLAEMYRINEHLKNCKNCRNELETNLLVEKTQHLFSGKELPSYDFSNLIFDLIEEKEDYINSRLRNRMLICLVFALFLLILSLLLFTHTFDFLGIDMRIM